VELDREAIERRDFPTSRRGYDPAAVDAHLRNVADRLAELAQAQSGGGPSRASSAGSQVDGIIAAAETAAADVLREAHADAARARGEAVEAAQAHVAEVGAAATSLLERVRELDEALNSVLGALRSGAGALATEAQALQASMGELFDAAGARRAAASAPEGADGAAAPASSHAPAVTPAPAAQQAPTAASEGTGGDDLDSARLIALNMALNGDSRADTERYLAENFQLSDRSKLVDEVFAAVEA
jgi:DivIVA domain-containing protein